jgi:hypothetical protein
MALTCRWALVLNLANMWQLQNADFRDLVPQDSRRTTVVDAVRRLTTA